MQDLPISQLKRHGLETPQASNEPSWILYGWGNLWSVGRSVLSSELVPGDVYEVTDPGLTQFPCDSLLLSGDCIVNESMLTGTS